MKRASTAKPSMFDGDRRVRVVPNVQDIAPRTSPRPVTRGMARVLIEQFTRRGRSEHSRHGEVLWVILAHCREQQLRYTLTTHEMDGELIGYTVEEA